jgi:magnesium/cobalt transport protein CorA
MDILHLLDGRAHGDLDPAAGLPQDGFVWLDFVREQDRDWPAQVEGLTGTAIHERHVTDTFNVDHPSFYDGTHDYDLLIFRGLAPGAGLETIVTRPSVYILLDSVLITVRPEDSVSAPHVKQRLLSATGRIPRRPVGLLHLLLTAMVDRFMALRDPLTRHLDGWRNALLDPDNPFEDWMAVMNHTTYLRQLEMLCEEQHDALSSWRDNTSVEFDDHLAVRFNDLNEHIHRIRNFARDQKGEVDSLVQMHFSAVAHRTNEIMRMLTVISAIFLPLTLVAGIFGMNFEYMPELKLHYAYFIALGAMIGLAVVLLVLFRKRRWI